MKRAYIGALIILITLIISFIMNGILIAADPMDLKPGYIKTMGFFNVILFPLAFSIGSAVVARSYEYSGFV